MADDNEESILLRVSFKWWVQPYVLSCGFFASLFFMEPDQEKISDFITKHGLNFEIL